MKRGSDVRILLPRMRKHLSEEKEVLLSDKFDSWDKKCGKPVAIFFSIVLLLALIEKLF